MSIQHFIITRFNIEASFSNSQNFLDPDWLDKRLVLFEKFCLPSMQHQTRIDFYWLILSHPNTPKKQADRLHNLISTVPNAEVVKLDIIQENKLIMCLRNRINANSKYLLTTRFDSDDAIHPQFVETLRLKLQPNHNRIVYNFRHGIILGNKKLYAYLNEANPFISLLEPITNFISVFHVQFRDLQQWGKLEQIKLPNAFVQVVHESNIWNRINGYWLGKRLIANYSWIQNEFIEPSLWRKIVNQLRFMRKKLKQPRLLNNE